MQELKDELLSELKISKDDLKKYTLNINGITNHYCDFCGKDCIGNFYIYRYVMNVDNLRLIDLEIDKLYIKNILYV